MNTALNCLDHALKFSGIDALLVIPIQPATECKWIGKVELVRRHKTTRNPALIGCICQHIHALAAIEIFEIQGYKLISARSARSGKNGNCHLDFLPAKEAALLEDIKNSGLCLHWCWDEENMFVQADLKDRESLIAALPILAAHGYECDGLSYAYSDIYPATATYRRLTREN